MVTRLQLLWLRSHSCYGYAFRLPWIRITVATVTHCGCYGCALGLLWLQNYSWYGYALRLLWIPYVFVRPGFTILQLSRTISMSISNQILHFATIVLCSNNLEMNDFSVFDSIYYNL